VPQQQEWTLLDVVSVFSRHRRLILVLGLAGAIAGFLRARLLEPPFLASATLQIGQVGLGGQGGPMAGQLVEPVARAAERLRSRSFQNAVLAKAGLPLTGSRPADLYRASFVARPLNNTDLIQVALLAIREEEGKRLLAATLEQLSAAHEQIARPTIQHLREDIAATEKDIESTRRELTENKAAAGARVASAGQFSERVFLGSLINANQIRLADLEMRKGVYEEQLSPQRTYPTSFLQPPSIDARSVAVQQALLGLVGGLMLGCFLAFALEAIRFATAATA
jgi:uncharacterized protein involved in exopolysaccharide biosynthesis